MATIEIKKLNPNAMIPTRGSRYAAGCDLYACLDGDGAVTIPAHHTVMVPTGIAVALPEGTFGGVFARSGLASREGLRPANCVGVIDSPFVTLTREGSELYRRSYSICRNAGFTPKVELYLSQIMTAYYMVAAGVGAAFVRSSLLNMVPENKDVIFYKVGDPLTRRPINLVYNGNRYINHAMQAFLNFIDALPAPYRV